MAPKRNLPKEDPPAPSTVEKEEEQEEEEEEEEDSSTESEDEDDGASPEEKPSPQRSQAQLKKPAIQEQDDGSESEEDSDDPDTDSDSDPPPPPKTVANVKPIASKPMEAKSSSKATTSNATASKARKRGTETETEVKDTKRRKESSSSAAAEKTEDSAKKQLFQRIWGEDDEIALLNGLLEFSKRGVDPFKEIAEVYDFVKKSLNIDISVSQLKEKAARLKKKFTKKSNGKDGEDKSFAKQHDQKCFDLSKKLWGSEASSRAVQASNNATPKPNKKEKGNSSNGITPKRHAGVEDGAADRKKDMLPGEDIRDVVIKKGLDMVEGSKRGEFEERWKDVNVATLKLFVQREQLVVDQAKLMLAAMDED